MSVLFIKSIEPKKWCLIGFVVVRYCPTTAVYKDSQKHITAIMAQLNPLSMSNEFGASEKL